MVPPIINEALPEVKSLRLYRLSFSFLAAVLSDVLPRKDTSILVVFRPLVHRGTRWTSFQLLSVYICGYAFSSKQGFTFWSDAFFPGYSEHFYTESEISYVHIIHTINRLHRAQVTVWCCNFGPLAITESATMEYYDEQAVMSQR